MNIAPIQAIYVRLSKEHFQCPAVSSCWNISNKLLCWNLHDILVYALGLGAIHNQLSAKKPLKLSLLKKIVPRCPASVPTQCSFCFCADVNSSTATQSDGKLNPALVDIFCSVEVYWWVGECLLLGWLQTKLHPSFWHLSAHVDQGWKEKEERSQYTITLHDRTGLQLPALPAPPPCLLSFPPSPISLSLLSAWLRAVDGGPSSM